jgi:hypothetical protein
LFSSDGGEQPKTLEYSPATESIYVANAASTSTDVNVIDSNTVIDSNNIVVDTVNVGTIPIALEYSPKIRTRRGTGTDKTQRGKTTQIRKRLRLIPSISAFHLLPKLLYFFFVLSSQPNDVIDSELITYQKIAVNQLRVGRSEITVGYANSMIKKYFLIGFIPANSQIVLYAFVLYAFVLYAFVLYAFVLYAYLHHIES